MSRGHSPDEFPAGQEKAAYVRRMFDAIVPRYDTMNRLMTGGRDEAWRRQTARLVGLPAGGRVLDVAAGTSDLSLALARRHPTAGVVALDFSLGMLAHGRAKVRRRREEARIAFLAGDALRLPFSDDTFDAVTSGFLMRNVIDVEGAFAEMRRVARPGGRVVCLEISKPTFPLFSRAFWWYLTVLVPLVGRVVSGHGEAYRYLPDSVARFVSADELKRRMERAGLRDVTYRRLMLGSVAIHVGYK